MMKKNSLSIACLMLISTGFARAIYSDGLPGQTPPGNIPQIFAPGIISLDNRFETYPAFSPDGNELYFTVVNASWSQGKILHSQKQNGNWSVPDTAIFSNNNYINWESFISPDGNRQFFASNRPPSTNIDIWMVKRTKATTWSHPIRLNTPVN
jgi:Tol biopolymer transport system component